MKAELENPFLVIDIPRFAVTGHMLTGNVEFLAQLLTAYSSDKLSRAENNASPAIILDVAAGFRPQSERWTNEEGTAAADLCFNCSAGRLGKLGKLSKLSKLSKLGS
ncbi:hypothetical protein AK812_SmicGene40073 [Symbiodinium microadriaticum]|uniref:Uncharacterized protein n=1 Tax=Symbiodinium microadriaticum TaxID=2951 RepID=A0A1Q9C9P2_SYMMI|nr:hypothetical protein AK812_SmicGene40073 [Symbiodinium microadriaticum]